MNSLYEKSPDGSDIVDTNYQYIQKDADVEQLGYNSKNSINLPKFIFSSVVAISGIVISFGLFYITKIILNYI